MRWPKCGRTRANDAGMIGCVQCDKDACKVLADTISPPTNDSLENIVCQGRATMCKDGRDGKTKFCFGNTHTHNVVLGTAALELFMAGDLAFCLLTLGKEGMAPHWCWRCQPSKAEWTNNVEQRVGTAWTLDNLHERWSKLQGGALNKSKSEQVRGVKDKAMCCIDTKNMLVPSLHDVELFVNTPIDNFMRWVHHRTEQLPLAATEARQAEVDLIVEMQDVASEMKEAKETFEFLKAEAAALKPTKNCRTKQFVFRDDDHKSDCAENQSLLSECEDRIDELVSLCADLTKDKQASARKIKTVSKQKEPGALSQHVRQRLEQMLEEPCKIIRSACHGGCLLYTSDAADE